MDGEASGNPSSSRQTARILLLKEQRQSNTERKAIQQCLTFLYPRCLRNSFSLSSRKQHSTTHNLIMGTRTLLQRLTYASRAYRWDDMYYSPPSTPVQRSRDSSPESKSPSSRVCRLRVTRLKIKGQKKNGVMVFKRSGPRKTKGYGNQPCGSTCCKGCGPFIGK